MVVADWHKTQKAKEEVGVLGSWRLETTISLDLLSGRPVVRSLGSSEGLLGLCHNETGAVLFSGGATKG